MTDTNTNETTTDTQSQPNSTAKSVVGALLDLGAAWAAHGLNAGKLSLENSARALEKTAKTLETLAREFEKKGQSKDAS
jgi:hypothetical protein